MTSTVRTAQGLVPSAAPATTLSNTPFPTGAPAGKLLLFWASGDKTVGAFNTPTDNTAAGTWNLVGNTYIAASVSGALWWKESVGGETTVTVTYTTAHYATCLLQETDLSSPVLDASAVPNGTESLVTSIATGTTGATTASTFAVAGAGVDSNVSWGPEATNQALAWSNSFAHLVRVDTSTVASFGHPGLAVATRDAVPSGTALTTTADWSGNTSPVADQAYAIVAAFRSSAVSGPAYEQNSFRARNDDGSEATATWKAAANTNWTQALDQNLRLRFLLKNSGVVPVQNTAFQLRYSKNGGAYTAVSATSLVARSTASPNVADGAALTEQMGGAGAYNPGTFDEADGLATCYTSAPTIGDDTEAEFCIQLRGADLVGGDTVDFRVYQNNAAIGTYTATPRATVSGGASGSVTNRSVGVGSTTGFTAVGKFSGVTNVRLVASLAADLSNPIFSPSVAVGSNSLAKATVSGLASGSHYYWGWERDGGVSALGGGEANTLPSSGDFSFAAASCADALVAQNPASMQAMLDRSPRPLFFVMLGDIHYANVNTTVLADHRAAQDTMLSYATRQSFYSLIPHIRIFSDHDFCGDASNRTSTGRDAAVQVFQEYAPSTGFVETWTGAAGSGAIYQQPVVVGRCVFIPLDTRSRRDVYTNTDSASKTMLGTAQKAWLKDVLLQYRTHVKFWLIDPPWIGGNVNPAVAYTPDDDHVGAYRYERKEMTDFCAANGVTNNMILAGDSHILALDDGRTKGTGVYSQGNFPVAQCAPIARDSSVKGGPYDLFGSPYPATIGTNSFQYMLFDVADAGGSTVTLTCRGFDSTNTQRLSTMTVTFTNVADVTPPAAPTGLSGTLVTA